MRLASSIQVKQSDNKPSTWRRVPRRSNALACACLGLAFPGLASAILVGNATAGVSSSTPPAEEPARVQSLAALARRAEEAVRAALPTLPQAEPAGAREMPRAQHRITAREPDPRLRLTACPTPLDAALPASVGGLRARTIVQVSCKAPASRWTVLVPVSLETEALVLVAARSLSRGQVPGTGDVQQPSGRCQEYQPSI